MTTIIFLGFLSAYSLAPTVGTMEYRQANRQLPLDLSPYAVLLAVDDCGLIGHEAMLTAGNIEYAGIVFDCAGADGAQFFSDGNDMTTPWLLSADADYWFWVEHPELVGSGVVVMVEVER